MQGVLLESAGLDRYLSLGKSGYPVFQSAQQILAALRNHPELLSFFAVPQRNEKGNQIDWYSPLPGHVIAWSHASEEERAQARQRLQGFTAQLQALGLEYVERGRKGRPDSLLFGELLQEACKVPSAAHIYLVAPAGARTSQITAPATAVDWAEAGPGDTATLGAAAAPLQPVLTFWGFVGNEEDRHKAPLYFLTPAAVTAAPAPVAAAAPMAAAPVAAVPLAPLPIQPVVQTLVPVQPWWKRWWLWLALLLLFLLALLLLRGCLPRVGVPGFSGVSLPGVNLPAGNLPAVGLPASHDGAVVLPAGGGLSSTAGVGGLEPVAGAVPVDANALGAATPVIEQAGVEPSALVPEAQAVTNRAPNAAPDLPGEAPAQPAPEMSGPAQLEIPKQMADGVAQFLNGKYSTRGGLVDDKTNEPLRLQYDFEKGKGQVEIKRSNGVTCKGDVLAAMQKGALGIASQGSASCDDGSSYDMPKIQCKPGTGSTADCTGEYGKHQFPIQMQRKTT